VEVKKKLILFLIISLFIFTSYIINVQKSASIISISVIVFLLLFYKSSNTLNINYNFIDLKRQYKTSISIFWLFILTIITQNVTLNFETITWDVASYAVASNEISKGYIPFETQWESKGPILFYIYDGLFNLSDNNYIYFRLLNDLILFIISMILFFTGKIIEKKRALAGSLLSSTLFILLMSKDWYVSEFSELYSLLFLSLAYYCYHTSINEKTKYIFIGIILSIATLINQASVFFLIPFIWVSLINNKKFIIGTKIKYLLFSFSLLHIFFVVLYYNNELLNVYFANYITIPIGYTGESLSSFYELRVWLRGFFDYNRFLFLSVFTLAISYLISNIFNIKKIIFGFNNYFLIIALSIYFIGSHNYYHHLSYFLYFTCFTIFYLKNSGYRIIVSIFILFASASILLNSFTSSFTNLQSIEETYNDYPLLQLSREIDSKFQNDYSIFALDYLLILNYLDKTNFSYIVHPMNHFEPFITEPLIKLNKITQKNVSRLISLEPDVIICNSNMIIRGVKTKIDVEYNCEVTDYLDNYYKLDTSEYRFNKNLFYYDDPTREINVYIKNESK